jgi:hypothetical protein
MGAGAPHMLYALLIIGSLYFMHQVRYAEAYVQAVIFTKFSSDCRNIANAPPYFSVCHAYLPYPYGSIIAINPKFDLSKPKEKWSSELLQYLETSQHDPALSLVNACSNTSHQLFGDVFWLEIQCE